MTNQIVRQDSRPLSPTEKMKGVVENKGVQDMIRNSLGENANAFATSIIELYADPSGTLKDCDPALVVQEAMKAATLKLPINKNLGFAYVIPYKSGGKSIPQFQMGYKGYIQLAIRSGMYRTINADVIYEGMEIEINYITGETQITGKKTSNKAIGYFAYFELLTGFKKIVTWETEKVKEHALKFSQQYKSLDKMLKDPKTPQWKLNNNVWYKNFDEMALKTVLKNLLSKFGVLSTEMQQAMTAEVDEVHEINLQKANQEVFENDYEVLPENVDMETGEIMDDPDEGVEAQPDFLGDDFKPVDEEEAPF